MRIFWICIIAINVYTIFIFIFSPLEIEGVSMLPTLENGEQVFVLNNDIFKSKIEHGDIINFQVEGYNYTLIKRVVALPEDKIQIKNGNLILNKNIIKKKISSEMNEFEEFLKENTSYKVLDTNSSSDLDNTKEYLVPKEHYFVLGDNRDDSNDSRNYGFIPYDNIISKMIPKNNFLYNLTFMF